LVHTSRTVFKPSKKVTRGKGKGTMTLISIEGNIGAGKSTLIETLKTKFSNVVFVDEPVDEWSTVTDKDGTTVLEKYYADQKRYAFAFQMMVRVSREFSVNDSN
jgi:deoxyadenosine/deoxycytidine kinase